MGRQGSRAPFWEVGAVVLPTPKPGGGGLGWVVHTPGREIPGCTGMGYRAVQTGRGFCFFFRDFAFFFVKDRPSRIVAKCQTKDRTGCNASMQLLTFWVDGRQAYLFPKVDPFLSKHGHFSCHFLVNLVGIDYAVTADIFFAFA